MKVLIQIVLICIISFSLKANDQFDVATDAILKGDFKKAVELLDSIPNSDLNASIQYNLGYCHYQLKEYGNAIWNFEKVLQLEPKNADAIRSLELAHKQLELPDYEPINSGLMRSLLNVGSDNWAYLMIVSLFVFAFGIYLFKASKTPSKKKIGLLLMPLFFLVACVFFILSLSTRVGISSSYYIVIDKKIPTYIDSKQTGPVTIYEGTRLELLEETDGLYQVKLPNDQLVLVMPTEQIKAL